MVLDRQHLGQRSAATSGGSLTPRTDPRSASDYVDRQHHAELRERPGERAPSRRSTRTTGPVAALGMRADQVFRRCLADFDLMADAYEMLAADYDWLFGDDVVADGGAIGCWI
jgi:hypothetical protein